MLRFYPVLPLWIMPKSHLRLKTDTASQDILESSQWWCLFALKYHCSSIWDRRNPKQRQDQRIRDCLGQTMSAWDRKRQKRGNGTLYCLDGDVSARTGEPATVENDDLARDQRTSIVPKGCSSMNKRAHYPWNRTPQQRAEGRLPLKLDAFTLGP